MRQEIERLADAVAKANGTDTMADTPEGRAAYAAETTIGMVTSIDSKPIIGKYGPLAGRQIQQVSGRTMTLRADRPPDAGYSIRVERGRFTREWRAYDPSVRIMSMAEADAEAQAILRYLVVERELDVRVGPAKTDKVTPAHFV